MLAETRTGIIIAIVVDVMHGQAEEAKAIIATYLMVVFAHC